MASRQAIGGQSEPASLSRAGVFMYWCFHCYALNDLPAGPCRVCGHPVQAPAGLTRVDGLVWALRHPDGDRAVVAAGILGRLRAREAVPALRAAVDAGKDIYLREAALRSVIAIEGAGPLREWLSELSHSGPFNIRILAREVLARHERAGDATAAGD